MYRYGNIQYKHFPQRKKSAGSLFSGGRAWVQILKPNEDDLNCQILKTVLWDGWNL
ncbi:hypothetical protein ACMGDK_17565 [Chryseobacterium sp. DT-3]|uniref:hypothetical protein n=1 Tax=Chryseobacterium sp. DT-3 TaxID=3396164 RepID=UPI003F1C19F5